MASIQVGDRIQVGSDLATVRFVGLVKGTQGNWIGIEWDDPTRGKHDGSHQGTRYFTSTSGGQQSCSFIRPHPTKVLTGRTFLEAFQEKYLETTPLPNESNPLYFGGNKRIVVEAVGFEKIEQDQQVLSSLKVVGLAEQQIKSAGEPGAIANEHLSIRDLDLSKNLIPCWAALAEITCQLPHLSILRLNHCRLASSPLSSIHPTTAFQGIVSLGLKSTQTPWSTVVELEPLLPNLDALTMSENAIQFLSELQHTQFRHLKHLNLELNDIGAWHEVAKLGHLESLEILYLNGNRISSIDTITPGTFKKLEYLRLDDNKIGDWASVDALDAFPALRRLRIKGNTILAELDKELAWSHIVGRIKGLTVVDGNTITPRERSDFERYYLTLCAKDGTTHEAIAGIHPRYKELCQIHGEPNVGNTAKEGSATTLKDRLMGITLCVRSLDEFEHATTRDALAPPASDLAVEKRVLGTARIRNLKHMIQKLFTIPAARQRLFLLQNGSQGELLVMELDDDLRDLHFYGVGAGDEIAVVAQD